MEENKTAEEVLQNHVTIFNSESQDNCFIDSHPKRVILAMEEYADLKITQQQETIAELRKQNDELAEIANLYLEHLKQQDKETGLNNYSVKTKERITKALRHTT